MGTGSTQLPPGAVGHNVPNIVRAKELAEIVRRTFRSVAAM
jgi:hypothetical protein